MVAQQPELGARQFDLDTVFAADPLALFISRRPPTSSSALARPVLRRSSDCSRARLLVEVEWFFPRQSSAPGTGPEPAHSRHHGGEDPAQGSGARHRAIAPPAVFPGRPMSEDDGIRDLLTAGTPRQCPFDTDVDSESLAPPRSARDDGGKVRVVLNPAAGAMINPPGARPATPLVASK